LLAAKPLFFSPLHKLLSLEIESKLSLYSLTAVFFCGCIRKGNKKLHVGLIFWLLFYQEKSDIFF